MVGVIPKNTPDVISERINSKMLIEYSLEAVESCELISDIILPQITSKLNLSNFSKISKNYNDVSSTLQVLRKRETGFCMINLCNPQLTEEDISKSIKLSMHNRNADVVESVIESDPVPGRVWKLDGQMVPYFKGSKPFNRRQDQTKGYLATGDLLVFKNSRKETFNEYSQDNLTTYGYLLDTSRVFQVKHVTDLVTLRALMDSI